MIAIISHTRAVLLLPAPPVPLLRPHLKLPTDSAAVGGTILAFILFAAVT